MTYARQTLCRPIDFGTCQETSAGYRSSYPTYFDMLLADVTYAIVLFSHLPSIELFGRTGQNRAMNAEQSFLFKNFAC